MIVQHVLSQIVRLPADEPLADGPSVKGAMRDFVVVKVVTKDGTEGVGVTFFGAGMTRTLRQAVDDLGALVVGENALLVERVVEKLRQAAISAGPQGVFTLALSALDMALWDIRGKALGQPVARLLGGFRDKVPAYASGALMRQFTL